MDRDCWKGEFEKNNSQNTFAKLQLMYLSTSESHEGLQLCASLWAGTNTAQHPSLCKCLTQHKALPKTQLLYFLLL